MALFHLENGKKKKKKRFGRPSFFLYLKVALKNNKVLLNHRRVRAPLWWLRRGSRVLRLRAGSRNALLRRSRFLLGIPAVTRGRGWCRWSPLGLFPASSEFIKKRSFQLQEAAVAGQQQPCFGTSLAPGAGGRGSTASSPSFVQRGFGGGYGSCSPRSSGLERLSDPSASVLSVRRPMS